MRLEPEIRTSHKSNKKQKAREKKFSTPNQTIVPVESFVLTDVSIQK